VLDGVIASKNLFLFLNIAGNNSDYDMWI